MFLKPYQMLGHAFARHSLAVILVVLVLTAAWLTAAAADCPMPAKPCQSGLGNGRAGLGWRHGHIALPGWPAAAYAAARYRLADGSMANVTIVREGYAQPFTKSPNMRYAALFRRCGQEAREQGRGLRRQP
jgi:hypothetical protein